VHANAPTSGSMHPISPVLLKERARHPGLADDRQQSARSQFGMIGDRNGSGRGFRALLHDDVAATPTNLFEARPT
jgi:hypothetical protein